MIPEILTIQEQIMIFAVGEEAEYEVDRAYSYESAFDEWCEFCGDERPCECDTQLTDDEDSYGDDF